MKLYYLRGACSHAPHILLREGKFDFQLVRFDKATHTFDGGTPVAEVNEKGYVPVLELDDGRRLTETAVVLQYLADAKPEAALAPAPGTFERYRMMEWLNFLATELHKSFWAFFHDGCEAERPNQGERLQARLGWVEKQLGAQPYLMGAAFNAADAYLVTLLNWVKPAGFDLARWPGLEQYRARVRERPAVQAALEAEGLLKRKPA